MKERERRADRGALREPGRLRPEEKGGRPKCDRRTQRVTTAWWRGRTPSFLFPRKNTTMNVTSVERGGGREKLGAGSAPRGPSAVHGEKEHPRIEKKKGRTDGERHPARVIL